MLTGQACLFLTVGLVQFRPKTEHIYMSSYEAKSREARLLEEAEGGFCLTDSF